MNKLLIACFSITLMLAACHKPTKAEIIIDRVNPINTLVTINQCPMFVSNTEYAIQAIVHAAQAAKFEHCRFNLDSISNDSFVVHVYGDHGYVAVWVNHLECSIVLEFFCIDDSYVYDEFIDSFMREFNAIENEDSWWEELEEMFRWDQ